MTLDLGVPAIIAAVVATICGLLAAAAWRAVLRTGNPAIGWVVAAFCVLSLKNYAKAFTLASGESEGSTVELTFTLLDLLAVAFLAWPILRNGGVRR